MKQIVYRFTGTEQDKNKFVDPEPKHDFDYKEKDLDHWRKFMKNPMDYFQIVEIEITEPELNPKDYLTPDQRLKIIELSVVHNLGLDKLEKYVAFGLKN